MIVENPDGGGERIAHVASRAQERFGLELTMEDIRDMEAALKGGAVCPGCSEVTCDDGCRFEAMRASLRLVVVKPHGHEVWNLKVRGKIVGVIWDPMKRKVRTVVSTGSTDAKFTVPLKSAVRIVVAKKGL